MAQDFTFNGRTASSMGLHVMHMDPPIGLNIEAVTVDVPNRAGEWFYGVNIGARSFPIDVAVRGDSAADVISKMRAIAAWLAVDEEKPFVSADEPDKQYMGIFVGDTGLKRFLNLGYGTITFSCTDPYAEDVTPVTSPLAVGVTPVDNTGDVEAAPTITLPFTTDATYVKVSINDVALQIGHPAQADTATVPTSRVELSDDLSSTSGWFTGTNAQDGVVLGPLVSDGTSFHADGYGTGAAWHGKTSRTGIEHLSPAFAVDTTVRLDNRVWETVTGEDRTLTGTDWSGLAHVSINGDRVEAIVVTHKTTGYVYTAAHDYDVSQDVEGVTRIRRQTGGNIASGQTVDVSYRYRKAKAGRVETYPLNQDGARIARIGICDVSPGTASIRFYASVWNGSAWKNICSEFMPSSYNNFTGIMRISCNGAGKWTAYFAKRDPDTGALSAAKSWSISGCPDAGPLASVELHSAAYGTIPAASPMNFYHVHVKSFTDPVDGAPDIIARAGETITIDCGESEIRAGISGEVRMDLLNTSSDDFPVLPPGSSPVVTESDGTIIGGTISHKRRYC